MGTVDPEILPVLVARNEADTGGIVVANHNLLRTTVRAIHPDQATLTPVVVNGGFHHDVSRDDAFRVVAAVRNLVCRERNRHPSSPGQHLPQHAELVCALPAQLNVAILFAGSECAVETVPVRDHRERFEKLLGFRRAVLKLQTL